MKYEMEFGFFDFWDLSAAADWNLSFGICLSDFALWNLSFGIFLFIIFHSRYYQVTVCACQYFIVHIIHMAFYVYDLLAYAQHF